MKLCVNRDLMLEKKKKKKFNPITDWILNSIINYVDF